MTHYIWLKEKGYRVVKKHPSAFWGSRKSCRLCHTCKGQQQHSSLADFITRFCCVKNSKGSCALDGFRTPYGDHPINWTIQRRLAWHAAPISRSTSSGYEPKLYRCAGGPFAGRRSSWTFVWGYGPEAATCKGTGFLGQWHRPGPISREKR